MSDGECRLCGSTEIDTIYRGHIREGRVGSATKEEHSVMRCGQCGVRFLERPVHTDYSGAEYRVLVDGAASIDAFRETHDSEQATKLSWVGSRTLRDQVVCDVGCGGGAFLDLVSGFSKGTIGIEPMTGYHPFLEQNGHTAYPLCSDALQDWRGMVDVVVCFSVIEHVEDPAELVAEVSELLRPGGLLVLTTPNADDWLLEVVGEPYQSFFYRRVHPWYFTSDSLGFLARRHEFEHCDVVSKHRFDLSNVLLWLRDKKPTGLGKLELPSPLSAAFTSWLEAVGRADYLLANLRKQA